MKDEPPLSLRYTPTLGLEVTYPQRQEDTLRRLASIGMPLTPSERPAEPAPPNVDLIASRLAIDAIDREMDKLHIPRAAV